MKTFNKFSKAVVAAAFLLPAFANASSTSTINLDITDLQINFTDAVQIFQDGVAISPVVAGSTRIDVTNVVFAGSNATAVLNGTAVNQTPATAPPFTLDALIGTPAVNGGESKVDIVGNVFLGANGTTEAQSSAIGNNTASADGQIINSFDAGVRLDVQAGNNLMGTTFTYNWFLDIIQSVFGQGGTTNGTYAFDITVVETASQNAIFQNVLGFGDTGTFNTRSLNNFGNINYSDSGSITSAGFNLMAGTVYTVAINQTASTAVTSIPAPGTIGLFGVSILAIAIIRRRKAK